MLLGRLLRFTNTITMASSLQYHPSAALRRLKHYEQAMRLSNNDPKQPLSVTDDDDDCKCFTETIPIELEIT